ncbi:MAG TPA: hypothetical protein VMU80_23440 [Bryobacteraceae bacterium]|nr:hypothetical protein [Bryobacteraceae bacterium]
MPCSVTASHDHLHATRILALAICEQPIRKGQLMRVMTSAIEFDRALTLCPADGNHLLNWHANSGHMAKEKF